LAVKKDKTIISSATWPAALPQHPDDGHDDAEPAPDAEQRQFSVDASGHGERLDRVLAQQVSELSRNYLQQLIEEAAVQVNGQLARKSAQRVQAGDQVAIELRPTQQSQAFVPEAMPIHAVYEDEHLLVIDKPASLVVHPAPGNWRGTLLNGLLARHPQAAQLPRAGIVHRLDKDTSGLMVVTKSRAAMDQLVKQIAARTVGREYLALAHRPWHGEAQRVVEAPIGRDPRNRLRMAVVTDEQHPGKSAKTTFTCLASNDTGCLVHAKLHTGRTHQIRVHLAHIGHPLLSDSVYGLNNKGADAATMPRQALHARRLVLVHPVSAQELQFDSPLPPDFLAACQAWGLRYNALD
jgi:23S rRNA pseudouridine1911/1915/1917 synthase